MEDTNLVPVDDMEPVTPEANEVPVTAEAPKKDKKKGCLGKALLILVIILAVLVVLYFTVGQKWLTKVFNVYTPFEATQEKLAELSPIPQDEAAAVDAMEGYSAEDTWAIYVYFIGADLESMNMDNLSPLTQLMIQDEAEAVAAADKQAKTERIRTFVEDVNAQGVEIPAVLYETYANKTRDADKIVEDDPDRKGYASADFKQMLSVDLPENVKLVVQTGGSKRWQNTLINPNRTQRFLLDQNGVTEVYNVPAINVATTESLVDFLKFATENYPADHKMVLFWNHGGGFTGYGLEELFGSMFSNRQLHEALEEAVGYDPENPCFEAIGFDACLMASAEAAHEFYGFAKYLLASEETEPGTGWDHETWLGALAADPGLIQDATLVLGKYDEESGDITYYGEDQYVVFDKESHTFTSTFTGSWLSMDDQPLATEIIDVTEQNVSYIVPMTYNLAVDVNVMFSYHFDDGSVDFIGVRSEDNNANTTGRDLLPIKENALYTPKYQTSNENTYSVSESTGMPATISGKTVFAQKTLPDGSYLAYIQLEDLRSDKYYSPIIEYTIRDGKIVDKVVALEYYVYDSQK